MDEATMKEMAQRIESMGEEISTMNGEKMPVILLTAIGGHLTVFCKGQIKELKALVCATMITNETLREVVCRGADSALDYIDEHPECTADE